MSYPAARAFIRRREGGTYSPTHGAYDPNLTRWGIRQDTYTEYGYPGSVMDITEAQWDEIFTAHFWRKAGCHIWPEPLDLVVADPAFHSGPKQALKFVQRGVSALPDGLFGPRTVTLVLEACEQPKGVEALCIRVQGQRIRFLKDLYAKSVKRRATWDDLSPDGREGERPGLAPISGWLDRVDDLGRTVGLH